MGIVAAVVILLFTFGSAVAMGLPIITALVGLVGGLSIFALLGQAVQIPTTAPALATMIGLGVGIDYGLFIVTRHRDQLRAGMDLRESIARTTATSGGAVLFAGGTVIIALLSLAVAGIPLVTTLGYTSAIVVLIAVTAATTLLPAILGLLGPRSTRCRSWACARITTSARTAGSGGPGSSPTTRGRPSWSACSCSSCSPRRCATSTSGRRTSARSRRTRSRGRPTTA